MRSGRFLNGKKDRKHAQMLNGRYITKKSSIRNMSI